MSNRALHPICPRAIFPVIVTLFPFRDVILHKYSSTIPKHTSFCSELNGEHAGKGFVSIRQTVLGDMDFVELKTADFTKIWPLAFHNWVKVWPRVKQGTTNLENSREKSASIFRWALRRLVWIGEWGSPPPLCRRGWRNAECRRGLTRDRLGKGGGEVGSDRPLGFSWLTSSLTSIDAKLGIPLFLSILRPYTKFWMNSSKTFWVISISVTRCHAIFGRKLINVWKKSPKIEIWGKRQIKSTKRRIQASSLKGISRIFQKYPPTPKRK